MSWAAHACRYVPDDYRSGKPLTLFIITEPDEILSVFKAASERLEARGIFGIEAALEHGSLCSRDTARAIEAATGLVPYGYEWTPEQVKEIAASADWSFKAEDGNEGNKESARVFFNLCAEQNLGIMCD